MFEKLLAKLNEKNSENRNGCVTYAYRSRTIPGLLSGLRHLRESGIFTDITLRAGETDFPGTDCNKGTIGNRVRHKGAIKPVIIIVDKLIELC